MPLFDHHPSDVLLIFQPYSIPDWPLLSIVQFAALSKLSDHSVTPRVLASPDGFSANVLAAGTNVLALGTTGFFLSECYSTNCKEGKK